MATFLETPRFPECISEGSNGGPRWATQIAVSVSGWEKRGSRWKDALHEYNAAFGVRHMSDMEELKAFFLAVRGPAYGFRYKDWADYKTSSASNPVTSVDQDQMVGDGVITEFQLVKNYDAGFTYARDIIKPVTGTVRVAVDASPLVEGVGYTVDSTTGLVTLTAAPAVDAVVTAGFEFDVPCRFVSDVLSTDLVQYQNGAANVAIMEIRQ